MSARDRTSVHTSQKEPHERRLQAELVLPGGHAPGDATRGPETRPKPLLDRPTSMEIGAVRAEEDSFGKRRDHAEERRRPPIKIACDSSQAIFISGRGTSTH